MKDLNEKLVSALSRMEQLKSKGINVESLSKSLKEKAKNKIVTK